MEIETFVVSVYPYHNMPTHEISTLNYIGCLNSNGPIELATVARLATKNAYFNHSSFLTNITMSLL